MSTQYKYVDQAGLTQIFKITNEWSTQAAEDAKAYTNQEVEKLAGDVKAYTDQEIEKVQKESNIDWINL